MDTQFRDGFLSQWRKYFGPAELPITFEYTDEDRGAELVKPTAEWRCLIAVLAEVRRGKSLKFAAGSFGCGGGRFYCGYSSSLRTGIAEFLSHDAKGEGERYKKNPDIAAEAVRQNPWMEAPTSHIVFKHWDKLEAADDPAVVIFFAVPDVLSGLFTLAGYDVADREGALMIPFSSGCGSIIQYPYAESRSEKSRAVLGMLDVSARPHVPENALTFAVPMQKFRTMLGNMDESFLITESWRDVKKRIG